MTQLNVTVTNDRFPELIARVEDTGERIVIEQEGKKGDRCYHYLC
ncbi:hypothetical protein [Microcoleus sp. herbarium12]